MSNNHLQYLSTRQPTFWPSDTSKQPDLLDFCITKGINTHEAEITSFLELSSDYTPILLNLYTHIIHKQQKPSIYNKHTDWEAFRETLEERIDTQIPLKYNSDIEKAIAALTTEIQRAARLATPPPRRQLVTNNRTLYSTSNRS